MTNYYEQQEKIQEEILARLQALEDKVFGSAVIAEGLTRTDPHPAPPVPETAAVAGEEVGTYSHPPEETVNEKPIEEVSDTIHTNVNDAQDAMQRRRAERLAAQTAAQENR